MTTENQIAKLEKEAGKLVTEMSEAVKNYPEMVAKSERAKIALSGIKKIETDEEDEKVEKLLVKVRNTYDLIYKMRSNITRPLDSLKKKLMIPEKDISTLATDKSSEYLRVKGLRDQYANMKFQKQQEEERKIKREKDEKEEKIRLLATIEKSVFNGIIDAVYALDQSVENFLSDLSLENFEQKAKKVKLTPKLKEQVYDSWFNVEYDQTKLEKGKFDEFILECKGKFPYDQQNEAYIKSGKEVLDSFIKKLPELKKNLEKIAEAEKLSKEEAEKLKADQAEAVRIEQEEKLKALEAEKARKNEELENNSRNEQLEAVFEAQVSLQGQEKLKNTRVTKKAIVNCKKEQLVQVFAKVLYACFSHPSFKGHLKSKDVDAHGVPDYEGWAATLLKFYAENCDMQIDGIEIKEIISTIQKK